jgi:alkylation response protein AidB-like acyl-CoA dehydrogenase
VNFDLTDEQKMLQEQARRYLAERVGYDRLRTAIEQGDETDPALWNGMAELGWLMVGIPEEYGGLGLGTLEQCVIAEELGRVVAPVPFTSSLGLAAEAILARGSHAQKERLLPALGTGEAVAALAFFEGPGAPEHAVMDAFACTVRDGFLSGVKWPVLDGGVADHLIVAAKDAAGVVGLYCVDARGEGVARERISGFDQLRAGHVVTFTAAPAERLGTGDARAAILACFDKAAVLTAFEQVGGAEAALYMGRDYALERKAFGRAIGSYQAIKHKLADMLTKVELARSNAYYAGWAMENEAPDRALAAATARVSAIEAYEFAARENMQVHGGISFTWEANCHFHYRRSRLLAVSLGAASHWSGRIIDQLLSAQSA